MKKLEKTSALTYKSKKKQMFIAKNLLSKLAKTLVVAYQLKRQHMFISKISASLLLYFPRKSREKPQQSLNIRNSSKKTEFQKTICFHTKRWTGILILPITTYSHNFLVELKLKHLLLKENQSAINSSLIPVNLFFF